MKTEIGCYICGNPGFYRQVKAWLCKKHYRLQRMRMSARVAGKMVPSYDELFRILPKDFRCVICREKMVWTLAEDSRRVASLQHDQSGRLRIICHSCNSRHRNLGDRIYDLSQDEKPCPKCGKVKKLTEFYRANESGRFGNARATCKECCNASHAAYVASHRHEINAYQRRRALSKNKSTAES